MATKSALTQQLGVVAGFDDPRVELEQYRTPPEVAAHLVHTADLQGDIEGCLVVDLGCGTGMLALASALRGPETVVGVDIDPKPLRTAQTNERKVATATTISWIRGDATRAPLCPQQQPTPQRQGSPTQGRTRQTTVVMNPPFGAQDGNKHADRRFLETCAEIADVSYSIHNADSAAFIEAFADDEGGTVTHAYAATFDIPRTFPFHETERKALGVELFRIEWR